jgi:hypothetical protein
MSAYDDLAGPGGAAILEQLYPHLVTPDCPMTADAVDDYLNTGEVVPVPLSVASGFDVTADWRRIRLTALINSVVNMGPNHHVVVRITRSPHAQEQYHLTANHYFVMANVGNRVYVFDAMSGARTTDVRTYMDRQHFIRLDYTRNYEATDHAEF